MSCNDSDLPVHPLIALLEPKPDDERRFIIILGYIGPTSEDGIVAVYPDLDLRSHLEISRTDILCHEPVVPGLRFCATRLVINATAQITRVENSRCQSEAAMVSGRIADGHLAKATPGEDLVKMIEKEVISRTVIHEVSTLRPNPHPTTHCTQTGGCTSDPTRL
jgi:hypothetical protein